MITDETQNKGSFTINYYYQDVDPSTLSDDEKKAADLGENDEDSGVFESGALFWGIVAVCTIGGGIMVALFVIFTVLKYK